MRTDNRGCAGWGAGNSDYVMVEGPAPPPGTCWGQFSKSHFLRNGWRVFRFNVHAYLDFRRAALVTAARRRSIGNDIDLKVQSPRVKKTHLG